MEISQIMLVLCLIGGLQFKHFICDGPLQTKAMVVAKSNYGAWMGIAHSGLHAIGTALVIAIAGFPLLLIFWLAVLDFVLHYHIDYAKENLVKYSGWTVHNGQFWWALSADQMLHQFSYLIFAFLIFRA